MSSWMPDTEQQLVKLRVQAGIGSKLTKAEQLFVKIYVKGVLTVHSALLGVGLPSQEKMTCWQALVMSSR